MLRALAVALLPLSFSPLAAQVDPSFGSGGYAVFGLSGGPSGVEAVAPGPDGTVYAVGDDAANAGPNTDIVVLALRPDGTLDASFGTDGVTRIRAQPTGNHLPADIVRLADGSLVIVGSLNRDVFAARLTADGALDPAFGQGGVSDVLFQGGVASVLALSDGSVLVAGGEQGTNELVLARIRADGTLDPGFGVGGLAVSPRSDGETYSITDLVAAPDEQVVVAGYIGTSAVGYDAVAMRYALDGTRDMSFGADGLARADIGAVDWADAAAVRPDGRVIVSGRDYREATFVVQFTADGALDNTFGDGGAFTYTHADGDDTVRALALLPDGRLLVSGAIKGEVVIDQPTASTLYVARLTAAGTLDATFGTDGIVEATFPVGSYSDGRALAVESSTGTVLAAGRALSESAGTGFAFARFLPDARVTAAEGRPETGSVLRVAPNPTAGSAVLRCAECAAGRARVSVFDTLGREVAVVHDGPLPAQWQVRIAGLRPGAYIVRALAPNRAWTVPFVVAR